MAPNRHLAIAAVVLLLVGARVGAADAAASSNVNAGKLPIPLAKLPELKLPAGDATRGEHLFNQNCLVCHGAGALGGEGPALAKTGLHAGQVAFMVRKPLAIDKSSAMPQLEVNDRELADIAAYVASLSAQQRPRRPRRG